MTERPSVGVAVIVVNSDKKVLFGWRVSSHGADSWQLPGGHLELGESIEQCAKRETLEETGIHIKNIRLGPYTNDYFKAINKHYVTLYVISEYDYGEVSVEEPHKSRNWNWFAWTTLPYPLFQGTSNLAKIPLESILNAQCGFDL